MYILNIISAIIKKMTIKELKDFMLKNYYRQTGFPKEKNYYSMKHQKKKELLLLATKLIESIPDASNAQEYYKSYLREETKLVKRSKIISQQPKTVEKPKHFSHKLLIK